MTDETRTEHHRTLARTFDLRPDQARAAFGALRTAVEADVQELRVESQRRRSRPSRPAPRPRRSRTPMPWSNVPTRRRLPCCGAWAARS